ncbi:MAG: DUF2953 domain-containing protein [Syntrophomonadaceae bacterium]|nr:DUF2953 domain-containing protein [Syntrophomonadaceae bacterium]
MFALYFSFGILAFLIILSLACVKLQIAVQAADIEKKRYLSIKINSFFLRKWEKEFRKEFRYDDFDLLFFLKQAVGFHVGTAYQEPSSPGAFWHNLRSAGEPYDTVRLVLRYAVIEKLDWKTVVGLNDAMDTAIGAGTLWALKGSLVSLLSSRNRLQDIVIEIEPDFAETKIWSRLDCILKIRIGYIILIKICMFVLKVRRYFDGYTTGKAVQTSH